VQRLGALPGVAHSETGRFARAQLSLSSQPVTLIARSANQTPIPSVLWMTETTRAQPRGGAIAAWVSEAAADLYGIRPGATFVLFLRGERIDAFAAGIWRDYEHQDGAVVIDSADYVRMTGDTAVNTVSLWLQPGVNPHEIENAIRDLLPATQYDLRTPPDLRRMSLQAFDRTFADRFVRHCRRDQCASARATRRVRRAAASRLHARANRGDAGH
jgi:putative ABC transport system permease protein